MKNIFILLTINVFVTNFIFCQDQPTVVEGGGTAYGLKGGLTMAMQRWNGADASQTLPSYHGAGFVEFYAPWKAGKNGKLNRSIFGLQLGYHRKGSAVRARYVNPSNQQTVTTLLPNEFKNIGLMAYLKVAYQTTENSSFYYLVGLRGEYTARFNLLMPNISTYVNRFVAGATVGAGYELGLSKTLAFIFEASVSPDITRQIHVPAGIPVQYQTPDGSIQSFPSNEQKIVNLAFEVSIGIKFSSRPRVFENTPEEEF